VNDSHDEVGAQRDPDLSADCVWSCSEEAFDSQVLFDPAEEEFDLPSHFVEPGDGRRRQVKMVAQQDEIAARIGVKDPHPTQRPGKELSGLSGCKLADLITADSLIEVFGCRAVALEADVLFTAGHEEGSGLCDTGQPAEVKVAPIKNVEGFALKAEIVKPENIMAASRSNIEDRWDWAPQIELSVELDSGAGCPEVRPSEQTEREIDGGRIQGVDRVVEFESKVVLPIESACFGDEPAGDVAPDAPVTLLVGIGQRGAGERLRESEVIERIRVGIEAGNDVPQTLSPGQLSKDHCNELLPIAEGADGSGSVSPSAAIDGLPMNEIEQLRKNKPSLIHGRPSWGKKPDGGKNEAQLGLSQSLPHIYENLT